MKHFKLNQKVRVNPSNDNDNYNDFKNQLLIITHIAKNTNEHPGFDNCIEGEYLYDLKTTKDKNVNCSLYDYELIPA